MRLSTPTAPLIAPSRLLLTTLLAAGLSCGVITSAPAQSTGEGKHQHQHQHEDHPVVGGGTLPAGWSARPDAEGDLKNAKVVTMGSGIHLTLGPAIILYQGRDRGVGPFHTLATFTQTKKTEHAEGYGLFFGGQALGGKDQKYTYFLIRQDGSYLIKRRGGEQTSEVSKGWVPHPAVHKPNAQGASTNMLEVDAKQDPSKVVFKVNGQAVYTTAAKGMDLNGIVGIRANHNLDLHVEGFGVHR